MLLVSVYLNEYMHEGKPPMKGVAQRFNQAAHQYDQYAGIQKQIAKRALTLFKANTNARIFDFCVDLGCGTAVATSELSNYAKVTFGLDISSKMLLQAKRKQANCLTDDCTLSKAIYISHNLSSNKLPAQKLHFINADAEKLPFKSGAIDAFYSSMALQWCNRPKHVIKEIKRLMKPNGVAVLAILVDGSFSSLNLAWQAIDKPSRLNEFHCHNTWLQAAQHEGLATKETIEVFSTEHSSVIDMLASIKRVGANFKTKRENAVPLGRQELASLEQQMRIFSAQTKQKPLLLDYRVMFVCLSHIRQNNTPSPIATGSQLLEV